MLAARTVYSRWHWIRSADHVVVAAGAATRDTGDGETLSCHRLR
jgi:hypothetical protein